MSKATTEQTEYLKMLARMIKRAGVRVGVADPEDLVDLLEMKAVLDAAICTAVQGQRDNGFSWADIARPQGVSRQAVQMKFAHCKIEEKKA